MPEAKSRKLPAPRRSHDSGILAAKSEVKFCEIIGSRIMTGNVPTTKPAMINALTPAFPDITPAARAADSVMHGKKTVTSPNAKFLARALGSRWPLCERFDANRLIAVDVKTNSRLSSNENPWAPRIVANVSESTAPAIGRISVAACAMAPIIAPTKAYDIIRPKLYRSTPIQISRRLVPALENPPQTSGPHMAAQCQVEIQATRRRRFSLPQIDFGHTSNHPWY